MIKCRICGANVPDKRKLPWNFRMGSCQSKFKPDDFHCLPEGCWDICDVHLNMFAKWYIGRQRENVQPTEDDLLVWVGFQIKTIADKMQKGFPGGYCECFTSSGTPPSRCSRWAIGYIGSARACKRHIESATNGATVIVAQDGTDPIMEAAKKLMEGHYGVDRTGDSRITENV